MENLLAQTEHRLPGIISGFGELGSPGGRGPTLFAQVISSTIGLMTLIAGIYFFFILVTGAIAWISAGGNKGKVEEARQRISNGLIGIVIVVAAIFAVQVVGNLIGYPYILSPDALIYMLTPGSSSGCIDSDGVNFQSRGFVTGDGPGCPAAGEVRYDSCAIGGIFIDEQYCGGGACLTNNSSCQDLFDSSYYCENGRCHN